jgi:hypothetical protein
MCLAMTAAIYKALEGLAKFEWKSQKIIKNKKMW